MANAPNMMLVKPGSISATDKSSLQDAGVIVIEIENPHDARLMRCETELPHSELLVAAGTAILASDYAQSAFGKAIAVALKNKTS